MECLEYDLLLPPRGHGISELLDLATAAKRLVISPAVESNNLTLLEQIAINSDAIGFTIPLDTKHVPVAHLFMGQLRFRALPVATAKFVEDIRKKLEV